MRKSLGFLTLLALVAATPAFAGNLSFENGRTAWHSTQCQKPVAPPSLTGAGSETAGNDMNALMGQYNAYVDAAQAYMNCLSNEAERDQSMVNQSIAASAQQTIAAMQSEVTAAAPRAR